MEQEATALAASAWRSTIYLREGPGRFSPILPRPGFISELLGDESSMSFTAEHYSPECLVSRVCELRIDGVLGSSVAA